MLAKTLFWASLGALAWTHAGYPFAARGLAALRARRVRKADWTPQVSVVVAAHDEETVIERRLENLLALDYPAGALDIVVASDGSTDRTDELVEAFAAREPRVRLRRVARGGKVAAQDAAVREARGEIVAFSDANAAWAPDALRMLVRNLADPDVAYVCGRLHLERPDGTNREGVYWRYELWLRESESLLGSITGGNGAIYALRREDYVEVDPRFGHDLAFPYLMVQRGRRAVYEPAAVASEKPTPSLEGEYRRKVRMFEHCWAIAVEGGMLRRLPPLYLGQVISHRLLRYGSGALHVALLASTLSLVGAAPAYRAALSGQLTFLALAAARPGLPRYYALVTWATAVALANYLRRGVPATWAAAEGTRV
jgi:cellulose synthase/poly-beta-1,6-N-acetylglucosamine synthase-like glycosyltransferase